MKRSYYVYILCDPRYNNLPFYVGKGQGRRATLHYTSKTTRGYNVRKDAIIDSIAEAGKIPIVETVWTGDNEDDAYSIEMEIIARFGRKGIDANGILTNFSSGGDGCRRPKGSYAGEKNPFFGKRHTDKTKQLISANNGRVGFGGKRHSEETKQKISLAKKGQIPWIAGRKHTDAAIQKMKAAPRSSYWKGKSHSEGTRQKIAASLAGKTQSDEAREKNRQAQLLRFTTPEGQRQRLQTSARMKQYWEKRRQEKLSHQTPA